jgi:hypothetical protein
MEESRRSEPAAEADLSADPSCSLTRSEASELADLKFHWDEAYVIDWADGVYRATRMGQPSVVLTAESSHELRMQIRDDYAAWQQSKLHERSSL